MTEPESRDTGGPGTEAGVGGTGGLGPATCGGVAGAPTACAAWASRFWTSGPRGDQDTGMRLCLLGSSLWLIGTDFQEHQIYPI